MEFETTYLVMLVVTVLVIATTGALYVAEVRRRSRQIITAQQKIAGLYGVQYYEDVAAIIRPQPCESCRLHAAAVRVSVEGARFWVCQTCRPATAASEPVRVGAVLPGVVSALVTMDRKEQEGRTRNRPGTLTGNRPAPRSNTPTGTSADVGGRSL